MAVTTYPAACAPTYGTAVTARPIPDYEPQLGDLWALEVRVEPGVPVAGPHGWTCHAGPIPAVGRDGRPLEGWLFWRLLATPDMTLPTVHLATPVYAEVYLGAARGVAHVGELGPVGPPAIGAGERGARS